METGPCAGGGGGGGGGGKEGENQDQMVSR